MLHDNPHFMAALVVPAVRQPEFTRMEERATDKINVTPVRLAKLQYYDTSDKRTVSVQLGSRRMEVSRIFESQFAGIASAYVACATHSQDQDEGDPWQRDPFRAGR